MLSYSNVWLKNFYTQWSIPKRPRYAIKKSLDEKNAALEIAAARLFYNCFESSIYATVKEWWYNRISNPEYVLNHFDILIIKCIRERS